MGWPCSRRRPSRARRRLPVRNGDEARCPSSGDPWCSSARGLVRVALDGFPPSGITKRVTLHAATRAGGHDEAGREPLLKCAHLASAPRGRAGVPLRGSRSASRDPRAPDGLVRITLKKPFSDGTVAVDLTRFVIPEGGDPLSLLSRLAASVPRETETRRLSSVGGAAQENIWFRRSDVPVLQRKDEAARACHGSDECRSVPAGHWRADRRAEADARSRTAVLGKSCAPSRCRERRGCRVRRAKERPKAALRPHAACSGSATSEPGPRPPRQGLSAPRWSRGAPARELCHARGILRR